jgi:hypothetical protein
MIGAALALAIAAPADRWLAIGDATESYRDFLDRESLQRVGSKVTLWTRREVAAAQRTLWHELEIDCVRRESTILAWVQDEAGQVSHNSVRPHRGPAPIAADSLDEAIFTAVCR